MNEGDTVRTLTKAFNFACRCHRDQRRRGASQGPYVNHLAEVATLAADATGGGDPDLVVAALLHEAVEDGRTSTDEIAERFGADVADLVGELTDDASLSTDERRRRQIERAAGMSLRARILKLCDKISNLQEVNREPPADWSVAQQRACFDRGKQVVDALRGTHAALEAAFDAVYARRP